MDLIYGYNHRTFWNTYEYTEFKKSFACVDDLKKAFNALKKDRTGAIKFVRNNVSITICYDSMSDFDRGILTAVIYTNYNSRDCSTAAYSIMKRACIRFFNGDTDTLTF